MPWIRTRHPGSLIIRLPAGDGRQRPPDLQIDVVGVERDTPVEEDAVDPARMIAAGRVRTVAFQASGEARGDFDGGVAAPANAIRGARVGCLDVQVRRPNIGPGPDAAIVIRTGAILLTGDQLTAQRRVRRPVLEFA